ncbi:MAG: hypothetical protein ACRECN_07060, partial [Methylocella sp.]
KMRRDPCPLDIAQPEIVRHDSGPPGQLESRLGNQFNRVQNLGLLIIGCIGLPQAVSAVRAKGALRESAQMIVWFFLIFGSIHDIYKIFYKQ